MARQRQPRCSIRASKEAVYKAWFPLARCWLDFADASLRFHGEVADARGGGFSAHLRRPGLVIDGLPRDQLSGRWLVRDGLVLTSVTLPR